MIKRLKNALLFYLHAAKRESAKELSLINALRNGKPIVAYLGWTGFANLGDEILYDAHVHLFPHLNIVPYRKSPLEKLYKIVFRKNRLFRAAFLGGGTLINQSDTWINQIQSLEDQGTPIFCLGTGVTENNFRASHEKTSLKKWTKVLSRFNYVGIRGPYSQQLLQGARFMKAQIVGDTALALSRPTYNSNSTSKIVGINYGLINENSIWGDKDEYTDNMISIIKQLIRDGYTIHLLPVWDKDIPSNEALCRVVNSPNCRVINNFKNLDDYQQELEKCSVFIGQKLHSTIMACMLRIPSIMIEYQPKCRDFMASIDMERWVAKTSECSPDYVVAMFNNLRTQYDSVQSTIDSHILDYRAMQHEQARKIEKNLLS